MISKRRLAMTCLAAAAAAGVLTAAGGGAGAAGRTTAADPAGRMPHPSKVAVITLENRSYNQVIGSRQAPYINTLAKRYALATRYYALTHPSLPNYIGLTSGSLGEITKNCASCDSPAQNLVGQMSAAGVSWKAYFEGLGSNTQPGSVTPTYNPHYNPFVYFQTVRGQPVNRSRVTDFNQLQTDVTAGQLPRFSWIAPSVQHDGHNGSLRQADAYTAQLVPKVLRALGPNGVLYLTWDEGQHKDVAGVNGTKGGGRVVLIAAGGAARRGATVTVPANHYALLRTIEANFGLRALGEAGSQSTPLLSGLLKAH